MQETKKRQETKKMQETQKVGGVRVVFIYF